MPESDAQKKEADKTEEELNDMTPEGDVTGGRPINPDAQKKESE